MTTHSQLLGNRFLSGAFAAGINLPVTMFDFTELPAERVLYESGRPIRDVYFPMTGLISALAVSSENTTVEAASVGREGIVGLPVFGRLPISSLRYSVTIASTALRVAYSELLGLAASQPLLQTRLDEYVRWFCEEVTRTLLCNTLHPVIPRCSRWLLGAAARASADRLSITHGQISELLGVRRPTVTDALRFLSGRGLIETVRGRIVVRDRAGLEAIACGCFTEQQFRLATICGDAPSGGSLSDTAAGASTGSDDTFLAPIDPRNGGFSC
jgi:CRP-like cAMP-binding protein